MRCPSLPVLLLSLGLGCTAATEDVVDPADDDPPLASYEGLMGGTPDNSTLPLEGKADGEYPEQHSALLAKQSPVQSQGSRGVCSIFATVALMEHLYIAGGADADPDFSEQYLQWSVKNEVGAFRNTAGSNAGENLRAISDYGIVEEALWPYEPMPWTTANDPRCTGEESTQPVECFTNGDPPQTAVDGPKFKLPRGRWLSTESIKATIAEKNMGVVVGMDFFYQSWNHRRSTLPTSSAYWRKGYVLYPNAKDVEESHTHRAGHAILIVGWDDTLEVPTVDAEGKVVVDADGKPVLEKGFYIFKNSWGTGNFGVENPHGAGYGFLSMRYVEEYGSAYVSGFPTPPPPPPPAGGQHYEAAPAAAIPDNAPEGITSVIQVPTAGALAEVQVTVDITHTYVGDLSVSLEHGGKVIPLQQMTGGSDDDLKKTFVVADLVGAERTGAWTLRVADTARIDTGTFNRWSLDLR